MGGDIHVAKNVVKWGNVASIKKKKVRRFLD